jgi:hypothetical protein
MTQLHKSDEVIVILRDSGERIHARISFVGDITIHVECTMDGSVQTVVIPWTSIRKIMLL